MILLLYPSFVSSSKVNAGHLPTTTLLNQNGNRKDRYQKVECRFASRTQGTDLVVELA